MQSLAELGYLCSTYLPIIAFARVAPLLHKCCRPLLQVVSQPVFIMRDGREMELNDKVQGDIREQVPCVHSIVTARK